MRTALLAAVLGCGSSAPPPDPGSGSGPAVAPPRASNPWILDLAAYETSCTTAADCAVVKVDPCNGCTCAKDAIARTALSKFEAARAAIKPCPEDARMCKKCYDDHEAACVAGRCAATKIDPCSATELAKRGTREIPLSLLQNRCSLKDRSETGLAAIVGRPLRLDEQTSLTFEITDPKRLADIVRCDDRPLRVDFSKLHVWFAIARGERIRQSVSTYDDGKRVTLVLRTENRKGCFGTDDPPAFIANAISVPADRTVEVLECGVPVDCAIK